MVRSGACSILPIGGLPAGALVRHATHGRGISQGGWTGHLKVDFPSFSMTFTEADGLMMIAGSQAGEWELVPRANAESLNAKNEELRQVALLQVRKTLSKDFLHSDSLFEGGPAAHLTWAEYEREKISFVQKWIGKTHISTSGKAALLPDTEQALAIATVVGHVQLVARAGSGKTETVANRAAFLLQHCGVAPAEMLLLAFNRDAANEMVDRVSAKLGKGPLPHIMTFHALAYALLPGAKSLLVNSSDGGDQSLNQEFQMVLLDAMASVDFERRVQQLMLGHFRVDWESIARGGLNLSRDEMLAFRRSLVSETLRGEYVKSYGEKVIANFLFEHDIPYFYEQHHWASGQNYRPDFTVPKSGSMRKDVVIEYFGLEGDPDYDDISVKKRAYWKTKADSWHFIELGPKDWDRDALRLEACLKQKLLAAGVPARRLSEDEIWHRARKRSIFSFTEAVSGFVGRCRKQWRLPQDIRDQMLVHHFSCDLERWFVELAVEIYELYLDRLHAINADDFDGLIQRAVYALLDGTTAFSRKAGDGDLKKIRYLFVDEYQDFTELFYQLIAALRTVNPGVQLFCVGDDWQAINRFAGSDLKFYNNFGQIFSPARRLQLTTNRRSKRNIVQVSNALMSGKGTPAQHGSNDLGVVALVDLAKFKPTTLEASTYKRSLITPVVLRIAGAALAEGHSVVLLSARNKLTDPGGGVVTLTAYLKALRNRLPLEVRDRLSISTAHGFKGNQCDVVIVLDATERNYPLIHPNWIFSRILGESESAIVDESRRLFYVALTRAKHALYVLTETGRRSPFLNSISNKTSLVEVEWSHFPPIMPGDDWLVVKVLGAFEVIESLIPRLKADGYRYRDMSRTGGHRTWDRAFRTKGLDDEFLTASPWMIQAKEQVTSGIKLRFFDGFERLRAEAEIVCGELFLTSSGTRSAFDISQLRSAFVAMPAPSSTDSETDSSSKKFL
jgi:DNA helicase-4